MQKPIQDSYKETEYMRDIAPYNIYLQALERVFDFSIVDGFADIGCSNGRLLEALDTKYSDIDLFGLEYFQWARDYADPSIKDKIHLGDIGEKYSFSRQYDIVNCSEVGEHIPPEEEAIFLDNLAEATRDILVLTWSNDISDTNDQHLNPRPRKYVINKMEKKMLRYWPEATEEIRQYLRLNLEGVGNNWWPKNIMIFKKINFLPIRSRYFLQKIHTDDSGHRIHLTNPQRNYGPTFLQASFISLTEKIKTAIANKASLSILRASDGDYYFLREIPIGSAAPGRRALTVDYKNINWSLFRSMFWHNDIIAFNLGKGVISSWRNFILVEPFEKISRRIIGRPLGFFTSKYVRYAVDKALKILTFFPFIPRLTVALFSIKRGNFYRQKAFDLIDGRTHAIEVIYSLISTKWLFKNFKNQIGLIGSGEKLSVIKELMKRQEYQNYLGTENFTDYLEVPQIGAVDNVENLAKDLVKKLKNSSARIFLVGSGSSKIALMPLLKIQKNAIFIDAGVGIDAIAGLVCQERPYFANWVNYRIKDFDYSKIDFLDQGNPAWNKSTYTNKIIE